MDLVFIWAVTATAAFVLAVIVVIHERTERRDEHDNDNNWREKYQVEHAVKVALQHDNQYLRAVLSRIDHREEEIRLLSDAETVETHHEDRAG